MTETLKTTRHRGKVATMPIPGAMWDELPVMVQLAMLQMEAAKFAATMHQQEVGGFRVVIVRDVGELETVLTVGKPEEKRSLVMPYTPGLIRDVN